MFSVSCSWRIGLPAASLPAAAEAWRVIRRIAPAYGRSAAMRCSARRRRAAATISIALVILRMFLTESIRCLTSRCAMRAASRPALRGRRGLLGLLGLVDALLDLAQALGLARRLADAGLQQRLALLVEVVAEVVGEAATSLRSASCVSSDQSPPAIFSSVAPPSLRTRCVRPSRKSGTRAVVMRSR